MSNILATRSPRHTARGALPLFVFACVACISDSPATEPDTRDTAEIFVVETSPEVLEDVAPEVNPEVVIATCVQAEDCTAPAPQCFRWVCPAGTCEAAPTSGEVCDDGNLCTGPGTCTSGVCRPGRALTCDGESACARATCDPQTGCGVEPVEGGVCEANNATAWGTCNGVRMAPIDRCDDGVCVDQSTPANVPISSAAIEGEWFIAAMWVHPTNANLMGGVATFDAGGKWGGTFRTNSGSFTLDDQLGRRGWCLDARNGVGAQVAINDYTGQMDANGKVLTATGAIGDEVLVGLRSEGLGVDTTGTYQAMYITANESQTELRVSYAILVFTGGCLEDASAFVGAPELEPVLISSGSCLHATPNGKLTMLKLDLNDDVESYASFVGALDANNDLGVFVLENGDTLLGLGMLTFVRSEDSARSLFTGPSRWVYSYQAPNPIGVNNIGFSGALYFGGSTLLNGTRGDAVIAGERIDFNDHGRFLLSLRSNAERSTMSGYLSKSLGFGFYYEVAAPNDWLVVDDVSEQPKRSAWGFMIRRP